MITPPFDFEYCQALKTLGFKQPTPKDGQLWYNPKGVIALLYDNGNGLGLQLINSSRLIPLTPTSLDGAVYCPTVKEVKAFRL